MTERMSDERFDMLSDFIVDLSSAELREFCEEAKRARASEAALTAERDKLRAEIGDALHRFREQVRDKTRIATEYEELVQNLRAELAARGEPVAWLLRDRHQGEVLCAEPKYVNGGWLRSPGSFVGSRDGLFAELSDGQCVPLYAGDPLPAPAPLGPVYRGKLCTEYEHDGRWAVVTRFSESWGWRGNAGADWPWHTSGVMTREQAEAAAREWVGGGE